MSATKTSTVSLYNADYWAPPRPNESDSLGARLGSAFYPSPPGDLHAGWS